MFPIIGYHYYFYYYYYYYSNYYYYYKIIQIVSQSHQLPQDFLAKLAQQEEGSERLKELEHRTECIEEMAPRSRDSASIRSGYGKGIISMAYSASPPGFGL